MELTKTLNDFRELESDLNVLIKTEKNIEYKRFLETTKINVGLWKNKLQYFFENADNYAKELAKETTKSDKRSH